MPSGVSGLAVAAAAGGAVLTWSGIKGASVTGTLRSLLSGQNPSATDTLPITTPTGTTPTSPGGGAGGTAPSVPASGHYTNAQLRSLWIMAGGDPSKAATAACIAGFESTGNPKATSANPDGGTNAGLWQLDTPGGKGAGYTVAQLLDPLTNARVAVSGSSNGTDWSAWATHALCGV